jgi:outer membrane lipopolysaccharide assembly protein LptE/RlpB
MGLFDGSNDNNDDSAQAQANQQVQQQMQQNQMELQDKRNALYQSQLAIEKSQTTQDFTGSNKNAPIIGK